MAWCSTSSAPAWSAASASTAARGARSGAVLGALFVTLISNSLNQLGVSFFMNLVVKGVAIIGFICLDRLTARRGQ